MNIKNIKAKLVYFYQARKIQIWISMGVLIAVIAALVIFLPEKTTIGENVHYVEVIRGSITESIGEVGYVEAEPSAALQWKSAGIVSGYKVQVGDTVQKDDVLMELDFSSWPNTSLEAQASLLEAELALENLISSNTDLQAALQAVTDAEWTLRDKKEDRDQWNFALSPDDRIDTIRASYMASVQTMWILEADYEALRQTHEVDDPDMVAAYDALQEADLERDSLLRALNQIIGHSYDQIVETDFIEYDQAVATLAEARAGYNRLLDNSQEIMAAEADVQALKNTINEARIISPFDGTVTEIKYQPGEMAGSGEMAVQIDDLSNLVVNIAVSEIDIAKIAVGQTVVISFDALPYKECNGLVTSIASAGTDSSGTVTFAVTVVITETDEDIKPGFTAVVDIITSRAMDTLLVPTQALLGQNGNYRVMVIGEDGTPMSVQVEVGASSDEYIEIVSGELSEGDQLVVVINLDTNLFGGGGFGIMGGMRQVTGGGGRPPDQK